jgi:AcrR family transcriptional regulator
MSGEMPAEGLDTRRQRVLRTREMLARAAFELLLEHGWTALTVEAISDHAEMSRRTFSRHFTGKEDALAEVLGADLRMINEALALRPADEPPLTAYRRAVADWLGREQGAWHRSPHGAELLRLIEDRPELRAAFLRVRQDAESRTAELMAPRIPEYAPGGRLRAALTAAVATAAFGTAVRAWVSGTAGSECGLAELVENAFDGLLAQPDGLLAAEAARPAAESALIPAARVSATAEAAAGESAAGEEAGHASPAQR